jgi:hypothetical protein
MVFSYSGGNMKQQFLINQFWANSIGAALQHSKAYIAGTSDLDHRRFRDLMKAKVERISAQYKNDSVSELKHINNIQAIVDSSREFAIILNNGQITFGIAQKILNLYLKFLWCAGIISEPPHCPLDSLILKRINWRGVGFTAMSHEDYKRAIQALKEIIGKKSLAQWELEIYNELIH